MTVSQGDGISWIEKDVPELEGIDESEYDDLFGDGDGETSNRLQRLIEGGEFSESDYTRAFTGTKTDRVEWCTSPSQRGTALPDSVPLEERRPVLEECPRMVSYRCRKCRDFCLNGAETRAVLTSQCWYCLASPAIEEHVIRFRASFEPSLAADSPYHPVESFEFCQRHAERGPHMVWVIAQQLGRCRAADHPPSGPPQLDSSGSCRRDGPPQDPDPEAAPLPWGADPEGGSQGGDRREAPTSTEPQRRLSDSEPLVQDGGQRD